MKCQNYLLGKIKFSNQGRYQIASIEEILTDAEFLDFKNLIAEKISKSASEGLVINLKTLDVIDSFAARILNSIASLAKEKGVPVTMAGINPVVADVMERQGLFFSKDSIIDADVSAGISRLENMQPNDR